MNQPENTVYIAVIRISRFFQDICSDWITQIFLQHSRTVQIDQSFTVLITEWNRTDAFMKQALIDRPQTGCHFSAVCKQAVEKAAGFNGGKRWCATADHNLVRHNSLLVS